MKIERYGIYLLNIAPTKGAKPKKTKETKKKTQLCVVVSPDEVHRHLYTPIVAPVTAAPEGAEASGYPTRVACEYPGGRGEVACDQVRAVDHTRLGRRLGRLDGPTAAKVARTLVQMFS